MKGNSFIKISKTCPETAKIRIHWNQKKEQEAIQFNLPQEPLKPMETFWKKNTHTHTEHYTTPLPSTPLQLQKQN
jgi:hypothetical protein